jgi:hypothetical protein
MPSESNKPEEINLNILKSCFGDDINNLSSAASTGILVLNNELRRLWKEVICVTFHALS